eukprot:12908756-Prorocentrum_lima.AAC.1
MATECATKHCYLPLDCFKSKLHDETMCTAKPTVFTWLPYRQLQRHQDHEQDVQVDLPSPVPFSSCVELGEQ